RLGEHRAGRHGRVVDDDVDRSESGVRRVDERVDLVDAPDVTADGDGAPPERLDLPRGSFAVVDLAAGDHDVGAGGREPEGDGLAEAAPAARDDRGLAGEVEEIPVAHVSDLTLPPVNDDRFYFRQLLAGRDFAAADPVARQMVNFVYLVGDRETG